MGFLPFYYSSLVYAAPGRRAQGRGSTNARARFYGMRKGCSSPFAQKSPEHLRFCGFAPEIQDLIMAPLINAPRLSYCKQELSAPVWCLQHSLCSV